MAKSKSTASSVSRKTKAERLPPGVVATPKCIGAVPVWVVVGPAGDETIYLSRGEADAFSATHAELTGETLAVEKRLATIVAETANPVSSDVPFAIITSAGIVATAATLNEGLKKLEEVENGHLVRFLCNSVKATMAEAEADREARRREFIRMTNPLAAKIATKCQAALDVVADLLGDKIELHDPSGQTYGGLGRGMRRATDRECSLARMDTAEHMTIDLNRDIAAQVVEKLTDFAKRLQAAAERVKAAHKAGKIPRPKTARRGKAVPA